MAEMKYVVVLSKEQGKQLFVFPKNVEHKAFAELLSYLRVGPDRSWTRPYREPIVNLSRLGSLMGLPVMGVANPWT